jgi:STE24 endopeptidase
MLVVILLFVGSTTLDTIVELLNLTSLSPSLPAVMADVYDAKKYKKSQEYLREKTKFQLIESVILLFVFLIFLVLGGFNVIDLITRAGASGEIYRGLIFAAILFLLATITSLPFEIYETFVIEAKFGFNKTTPKTFVKDFILKLILTTIIGGIIFAAVLLFFLSFGSMAWIIAWGFVSLVQLFLIFLAPIIIMPLFNKYTPLSKGALRSAIEQFAKSQHFALSGIFTMDSSKRSTKSNAFFTGFGKYKRIVLFDTLIKNHTTSELVAVLAHEIGHYKRGHIVKLLAVSITATGISFFILSRLINNPLVLEGFGITHTSIYASFVIVSLLAAPFMKFLSIPNNIISRKFEYEADEFALMHYKHAKSFVSALKKLSRDNLSNLTPHPLKVWMDYSHPPVIERIAHIESLK